MARKLALILSAIILPGGFIALFGLIVIRVLIQTRRGRKVVALAQNRVAAFRGAGASGFGERQTA